MNGSRSVRWIASFAVLFVLVWGAASAVWGESFYDNKTVRIVSPWDPGASPDMAARLYARHLPRFIPGNPRIIVQNVLGAGGVIGANFLYRIARADGQNIGITEPPLVLTQLAEVPGVKFDMGRFEYIGAVEQQTQLILLRGQLPYKTFEEARKAEEPLIIGVRRIGSSDYVGARALQALGIPIKIVTGYSTPQQYLAFEREEVDLLVSAFSTISGRRPEWTRADGPVHRIAYLGNSRPEVEGLPNIRDLKPLPGQEGLVKISDLLGRAPRRLLTAPPGVAKERLETLRDAFRAMINDEEFLAEAKKLKFRVAPVVGEEVQQSIEEFSNDPVVKENVGQLVKK